MFTHAKAEHDSAGLRLIFITTIIIDFSFIPNSMRVTFTSITGISLSQVATIISQLVHAPFFISQTTCSRPTPLAH